MPNKPVIRIDPDGAETHYPSVKAASEATGIGMSQITTACLFGWKCHGFYWRKEERNADRHVDEDVAMELYKDGKRDFEIAEECNVSKYAVQRWRARNGFLPNKRKPPGEMSDLEKTVLAAKQHGMTYGQWMAMYRNRRETYESEKLENMLLR